MPRTEIINLYDPRNHPDSHMRKAMFAQAIGQGISNVSQALSQGIANYQKGVEDIKQQKRTSIGFAAQLAGGYDKLPQDVKNQLPDLYNIDFQRNDVEDVVIKPTDEQILSRGLSQFIQDNPDKAYPILAGLQTKELSPTEQQLGRDKIGAVVHGQVLRQQTADLDREARANVAKAQSDAAYNRQIAANEGRRDAAIIGATSRSDIAAQNRTSAENRTTQQIDAGLAQTRMRGQTLKEVTGMRGDISREGFQTQKDIAEGNRASREHVQQMQNEGRLATADYLIKAKNKDLDSPSAYFVDNQTGETISRRAAEMKLDLGQKFEDRFTQPTNREMKYKMTYDTHVANMKHLVLTDQIAQKRNELLKQQVKATVGPKNGTEFVHLMDGYLKALKIQEATGDDSVVLIAERNLKQYAESHLPKEVPVESNWQAIKGYFMGMMENMTGHPLAIEYNNEDRNAPLLFNAPIEAPTASTAPAPLRTTTTTTTSPSTTTVPLTPYTSTEEDLNFLFNE